MIIQLIAPSGYPPDLALAERGVAFLRKQGHIVRGQEVLARRYQRFAGEDQMRAQELNAIADLPEDTQIVMAVRGGYGLTRLLPYIDFDRLRARIQRTGLKLVGHSDFTVLQLAMLSYGLESYSGPMLCADFGALEPNAVMLQSFYSATEEQALSYAFDTEHKEHLEVEGMLWGGNLSVLCSLLETPYFPKIKQGILAIEDVNEHPYRVERMLLQLHYAGVLAQQKALLLGDFSKYRLSDYDQGYDFSKMVQYLRTVLSIPIVLGLPFGHIDNKLTLPLGKNAKLVVQDTRGSLHC